jgi:hypothetical protein
MQWEYLIDHATETYSPDLNKLGNDGWELCAVDDYVMYFKRPKVVIDTAYDEARMDKGTWLR